MKTPAHCAIARALLAWILIFSAAANADGFYIGAGVYETSVSFDALDDDDYTPAAFVGYQFLDTNFLMLSGELGYYDLGDYSDDALSVESSAFTLAGVAYLPIGPFFEVYAKAGIAAVRVDVETPGAKDNFDDEEAFGGVGFSFDILDTIDLYAEYLKFDTEVDSEMLGIGVRLDF
jgi:opacity protein-like surface antigen